MPVNTSLAPTSRTSNQQQKSKLTSKNFGRKPKRLVEHITNQASKARYMPQPHANASREKQGDRTFKPPLICIIQ